MPASTTPDADSRAERQPSSSDQQSSPIHIGSPGPDDGPALWRLARDSGELDLNSPYAYLIWCRDFSETSVVAREGHEPVGFITGYRRPEVGEVLFVWQVAVDPAYRGQRIGVRMLDAIGAAAKRLGCRYVEATVTPDNTASLRMFSSFARTLGAPLTRTEGFDATQFPDHHQPEDLIRIGPL